jgi:hypothetical protein
MDEIRNKLNRREKRIRRDRTREERTGVDKMEDSGGIWDIGLSAHRCCS